MKKRVHFEGFWIAGLLGGAIAYFGYAALLSAVFSVTNESGVIANDALMAAGTGLLSGLGLAALGLLVVVGFYFLAVAIVGGWCLLWALSRLGGTSITAFTAGGAVVGLIIGGAMGVWLSGGDMVSPRVLASPVIGVFTGVISALVMRPVARGSNAPAGEQA
jgi:hypothetical protein